MVKGVTPATTSPASPPTAVGGSDRFKNIKVGIANAASSISSSVNVANVRSSVWTVVTFPLVKARSVYRYFSIGLTRLWYWGKLSDQKIMDFANEKMHKGEIKDFSDFKKFPELKKFSQQAAILAGIYPVPVDRRSYATLGLTTYETARTIQRALVENPQDYTLEEAINDKLLTREQANCCKWLKTAPKSLPEKK